MVKKKDEFTYGSQYIPTGETKQRIIRWNFGGLNLESDIDTGQLSGADGVIIEPPGISSALKMKLWKSYAEPISIHGFGDAVLVIYRDSGKIKADYLKPGNVKYTGTIGNAKGTTEDFTERTAVQFNVASGTENIAAATFVRKILIYPDRVSMDFEPTANFTPASLGAEYPPIKYASVYCSRLFGVNDNLVYASAFNDYANFNLDTADDFNTANAWVSMSQSNVRADGKFTAIWTYDNHVVLFKRDFMQLVYNNKNPFRIVDVGSYGCDNAYAVAETDGILYFASEGVIYRYTGGTPKKISGELGDSLNTDDAVLGGYRGRLYVQLTDGLYTYKDGVWSKISDTDTIEQFTATDWGLIAKCKDGLKLLDYDEEAYGDAGGNTDSELGDREYAADWWFETDFIAGGRLDVRRIKKISLLCDIGNGASVKAYLMRPEDTFNAQTMTPCLDSANGGRRLMRSMIRMTSCYMHKIRITGSGDVKVLALELILSWGGDLYIDE